MLNAPIVFKTWRQVIDAPLRIMGLCLFLLVSFFFTRDGQFSVGTIVIFANIVTWTLGAGLISNEIKSGVLMLVFSRPVRREIYVLSKWVALWAASAGVLVVFISLMALLNEQAKEIILNGGWAGSIGVGILACMAAGAVIVLLSAIPHSFGDLGMFIMAWLILLVLVMVSRQSEHLAFLMDGADWGRQFLWPSVNAFSHLPSEEAISTFVTRSLVTIVVGNTLAIALIRRMELSYASTS